jgi:hypothetical protein
LLLARAAKGLQVLALGKWEGGLWLFWNWQRFQGVYWSGAASVNADKSGKGSSNGFSGNDFQGVCWWSGSVSVNDGESGKGSSISFTSGKVASTINVYRIQTLLVDNNVAAEIETKQELDHGMFIPLMLMYPVMLKYLL